MIVANIESIVQVGGYPFLFFSILFEGLPLIGTLIPGHISIVVAGFLSRVGIFDLWFTLSLAVTAAILGDYIGYILGKKYGMGLIDKLRPYFFLSDQSLKKAQDLLLRHTGKAMVLGRLSPMTRALMPFLVGANGTDPRKFWMFNVIGGLIWSILSVLTGYVFGAGYQAAAGSVGKFMLAAFIIIILIIWGYRFVNMRFHIFKKYELFVLILSGVSLLVLAKLIQDTWTPYSSIAIFDVWMNIHSSNLVVNIDWFVPLALMLGFVGATPLLGGIGALVAIGYLFMRRWRTAGIILLSIFTTTFSLAFMKEFFVRLRPDNALQYLPDYSFPSAHAGLSAAIFTVVAYLIMTKCSSWIVREVSLVLCVLATGAIGVSRVVLNVHWASDVIAGWALGIFFATLSILLIRYVGGVLQKGMDN